LLALRPAVTIPEGARLTKALQKTEIGVDEEGTEAISVTYSGGVWHDWRATETICDDREPPVLLRDEAQHHWTIAILGGR
jgi:hypothetical protein